MIYTPRPHDLIHVCLEPAWFHFEHDAEAAFEHLRACPLLVVRRGSMRQRCIPIGVRGSARSERYAGWMQLDAIERIDRPADLLQRSGNSHRPAFSALDALNHLWRGQRMCWGPTGSVGFELSSSRATATAESDLDIQIRVDRPFQRDEAQRLLEDTLNLQAAVDVLVETPFGGFSLAEYANSDTCLMRTDSGPILTADPWHDTQAAA